MGQNFKEKKRSKGQMRVICALFRTKNCSYHYTRHFKMMRVRQIRVISSQFFQCCSIENTHCPNFTEYWLWSERDWSWHSPLIISGTCCRWHCSLSGRLNVNKQLLSSPSISDFRQQPTFIIVIIAIKKNVRDPSGKIIQKKVIFFCNFYNHEPLFGAMLK